MSIDADRLHDLSHLNEGDPLGNKIFKFAQKAFHEFEDEFVDAAVFMGMPGSATEKEDRARLAVSAIETGTEIAALIESGGSLFESGMMSEAGTVVSEAGEVAAVEGNNRGIGSLNRVMNRGKEWVGANINQIGQQVGISSETMDVASSFLKKGAKARAIIDQAGRTIAKSKKFFEDYGSGRVTPFKALGFKNPKLGITKPTIAHPIQGNGVSNNIKEMALQGVEKVLNYSGMNNLTYDEPHDDIKHKLHHPHQTAYRPVVKSVNQLLNIHRKPNTHITSMVPMNIGERAALMDVVDSGFGSMHWGSSPSSLVGGLAPHPQGRLLSSY